MVYYDFNIGVPKREFIEKFSIQIRKNMVVLDKLLKGIYSQEKVGAIISHIL